MAITSFTVTALGGDLYRLDFASDLVDPTFYVYRDGVLVIEDDPAARELLRVHLEGAGYAVASTGSGRQGLAWLGQLRPDAVLLDILLPDLDGWEILQRAKGDPATRSIPIMVVSVDDALCALRYRSGSTGSTGSVSRITCELRSRLCLYRAELTDTTMLATTAPVTVPATPSQEAATAADAAASAPASSCGMLSSRR